MFYNLSQTTDSLYGRGALIFFLALLNSTLGGTEVCFFLDDINGLPNIFSRACCCGTKDQLSKSTIGMPSINQ